MAANNFLTPPELAQSFVGVGVGKASLPIKKMLLLGILAGVYIGFAAHLATTVATGWTIGGQPALFGLQKFFIGAVFSVGLMLVIIPGSELFTGNNLMTVALCHGKLRFGGVLRNWIPVYFSGVDDCLRFRSFEWKCRRYCNQYCSGKSCHRSGT